MSGVGASVEGGVSAYREMSTEAVWAERRRLAALRDPAMMGRYLEPLHYRARAHTKLIARELTELGPGRDRLLVTTPPQIGKSVLISELFPFWWLAKHPRDRIIIGSYAANLSVKKSKAVREKVTTHGHRFGMKLAYGAQAGDDWSLTTGGGIRAAGVGGSLTGHPANCLTGETSIEVPSGRVPIGWYVGSGCLDPVLSFDHRTGTAVWADVTATSVSMRDVVDVLTRGGHAVRCTADHRFYVPGRGYVPAGRLTPGTRLLAAARPVPGGGPSVGQDVVAVVRPVHGERARVYDLQVEGTKCFFAGRLLVHNCALVDDPHKDRAEAESTARRDAVWDWWSAVVLSRLSPGAPAVLVLTRWHERDLAGRLLEQEGKLEEGGRWRVVHLPALAKAADDPLGREPGEPLTHPAIADSDVEALRAHWEDKRQGSTPRDWTALYQGDPKPREGALINAAQLERQRHPGVVVERVRRAVAVDPSGGGRDTAGIIAGFLGLDQRVYVTHDRTRVMPSTEWAREVCLLAHETEAGVIFVEKNFGGDLSLLPIAGAWDALQREGRIPKEALKPYIAPKTAKSGKVLRAEPIAQAWLEDRVRTYAYLPELEDEWLSWRPGDDESPGRIDASVYLVYGLLQLPGSDQHIGNAAGVSLTQAGSGGGGLGAVSLGRGR